MTLTLSSKTGTLLQQQAGLLGEEPDALADALLQLALEEPARDYEETCQAIAEGLAEAEAGRPPISFAGSGMRQGNGSSGQDDSPLCVYRLRFTNRALTEIDIAHDRLAVYNGKAAADAWEKGLFEEIAKLGTLPLRHPAPAEAARFHGNA